MADDGKNAIGLTKADYLGGKSTLCTGCGHDSITNHIITAFHQAGVNPYQVTKLSGIGCSSKTPAYFLGRAHGFNGLLQEARWIGVDSVAGEHGIDKQRRRANAVGLEVRDGGAHAVRKRRPKLVGRDAKTVGCRHRAHMVAKPDVLAQ